MGLINDLNTHRLLLLILIMGIMLPCTKVSASASTGEITAVDQIKAASIYHFLRYLQWPEDNPTEAYTIAVLGSSPIFPLLKEISLKKKINEREIIIKQFARVRDIEQCHILFIPASTQAQLPDILQQVKHKPIVTVSENEGCAQKGTAINFVIIGGKVKFEINTGAIKKADIRASSQLLKLAVLVEEKGEQ